MRVGESITDNVVVALRKIDQPCTAAEIAEFMGVGLKSVTNALRTAVTDGRVSMKFKPRPAHYTALADAHDGAATPSRMENYIPVPESGCWLWLGGWDANGYGKVSRNGKVITTAHRLFYFERNGPIPTGLVVCHKCDTPACCNPDHLFLGTYQDNIDDMIRKGRGAWQKEMRNAA